MAPSSKSQTIGILIALAVLIGGGYLFMRGTAPSSSMPAPLSTASTTNSDIAGGTLGITGTGGYTVKEVPTGNNAPKAPDYNTPLVFSATSNLNIEQQSALQGQVTALRVQLAKNPSSYVAWLALGRAFKTAGDYAQAAEIWAYLSLNWPTDAIAFANLGDLYMNFIKDYPKAEASYLGAIRNNPLQVDAYRNLFSLYTNLYTTHASAAEDILKKGIANNSDAVDLYVLLARYYRDSGRTAEARAEYDSAIVQAKKQPSSAALVADITSEQAALK
ncbi:MAG: tetratricopeptide repeat protein [bacterium]|nr:tetratricopeptide repeat protein [bacterium]